MVQKLDKQQTAHFKEIILNTIELTSWYKQQPCGLYLRASLLKIQPDSDV